MANGKCENRRSDRLKKQQCSCLLSLTVVIISHFGCLFPKIVPIARNHIQLSAPLSFQKPRFPELPERRTSMILTLYSFVLARQDWGPSASDDFSKSPFPVLQITTHATLPLHQITARECSSNSIKWQAGQGQGWQEENMGGGRKGGKRGGDGGVGWKGWEVLNVPLTFPCELGKLRDGNRETTGHEWGHLNTKNVLYYTLVPLFERLLNSQ